MQAYTLGRLGVAGSRTIVRTAGTACAIALALSCATSARAQNCPADLDNSGVVDGADLGILLGAWNTPSPLADINHDGIVDGADLGLLLGAWGPCPPSLIRQFGLAMENVPMTLVTPTGTVTTIGSSELLFTVGPPAAGGVRPVHLDRFTFLLASVPVFTTQSGGIGLTDREDGQDGFWLPSGQIFIPVGFDAHYWLIDQLLPPNPTVCTEFGGSDGFTALEQWNGSINGMATDQGNALFLSASLQFGVAPAISGAFTSGGTILARAMPEKTYPGLAECPAANKCNKRKVCIQPVFIGTGADDANKTGGSYADMKAKADTVWAKCCVELDWQAPKFVNNNAYKTLKLKATGDAYADFRALLKEVDEKGENDCIEVFFVSHMQDSDGKNNADGDGDTFDSGTKSAQIIVADDATVNCNPKADGVLAHELGHAMGDCSHPDGKAAATGTCMEPTGKTPPDCPGVNTSKVKDVQCTKVAKGPLVKEKDPKTPCCKTPDA